MENKYKVAVYGSLRKGLYNHYLMSHSDFIKTVSVEVPFKMPLKTWRKTHEFTM